MTIPFFRDGFALPVAQALLVQLNQEVAKTELNLERLTQLTFNFRNPSYNVEQGGVHPVEIRLIRGLDGWLFDYVGGGAFRMQCSIVSIIAAFACSTLIGVLFGFLPARRAAQLDPVDALSRQ